ncbi:MULTISPECIES: beta-galactosidase [unclassified Streptomyces]|uniref:glycoside hydrolase family 35 protein n=1 Tax=unclassified Streptomyces TaxID=2593676 RepID=UPI000DB9E69C|nr:MULTISPECIES: beta-galactosidase [unclassified Streptomyces]MYT68102.1 beta-galactosidase [Streptomyces sp. SID8367]RAJ72667.1 beta-galactosidase [Streptomyces sp. PsTaAH-137]
MSRFEIDDRDFLLDGEPFRVLSGALHYFRVHPDHWHDRIRKARLMGLNTIETYVPWGLHAPEPDAWISAGNLDLDRFLTAVADEGMHAIVRPGPYICAEFTNGGLPTWLFTDPTVGVRRGEPRFMRAIETYLDRVLRTVVPRQIDAGGPVILVQVENEYGAYGDDAQYLDALTAMMRDAGVTVPLTTVDQPQPHMLENGSRPGLLRTASFGSRSTERLRTLREHQPTGPLMSSEYWDGWFDSWGMYHHTTSAEESAADLADLLDLGASVNLYMFHGGTNFGLTNGANDRGVYQPIATTYDYDAPLDEAGRPTAKYWAYREVLGRHTKLPEEVPSTVGPAPTGEVRLGTVARFPDAAFAALPVTASATVPTFAELRSDAAYLLHRTPLARPTPSVLTVGEVRDRVHVVVDGNCVGVLQREDRARALTLPPVERELLLVVEDQGRVNYGPRLGEDKGVIGDVLLDGAPVTGWESVALGADDVLALARPGSPGSTASSIPALSLASGTFDADDARDRFLDTSTLCKGVAWINGFCLGRYWSRGPQRTLYVPGPVLRPGEENTLVVLELDTAPAAVAHFVADLDLGPVED